MSAADTRAEPQARPADTAAILSFEDAASAPLDVTGHKASRLSGLAAKGYRVPDGFVVTAPVFEGAIERAGLSPDEVADRPDALTIPDDAASAIREAVDAIGGAPVAVRSSGVAEDLGDASFAGQYRTELNVEGADAVLAAVQRCWASAFAPHLRAYREEHGIQNTPPLAVLVQRMVPADAAGVAFSADPIEGDRNIARISAVEGVGERLVSGEATPDEWSVGPDGAKLTADHEQAITEAQAREVAELARRVESELGSPQDIEWAYAGGELHLLQARPITNFVEKPEFDLPTQGSWMKDRVHYPELVTPFGASVYLPTLEAGIGNTAREFGMMIEAVEQRYIGGEIYGHPIPPGGKEGSPPPWWVMAALVRVIPPMRAKMKAAKKAIRGGQLDELPKRWEREWRPQYERECGELLDVDLSSLDDRQLVQHLEAGQDLLHRGQIVHFRLFIPYVVRVHELATTCEELLGWELLDTLELVAGISDASSEPARALNDLVEAVAGSPAAQEATATGGPGVREQLATADPAVAEAFDAYLERYGQRATGYDPGAATLAERPELLAGLIRDRLSAGNPADIAAEAAQRRNEAEARARAALSDRPEAERQRFEQALRNARAVYGLREDNIFWTDNLPCGVIRRGLVEAGRRLEQSGAIRDAADAAFLEFEEIRSALAGSAPADLQARADRRRAEQQWVAAHPGPELLGSPPAPPPDMRGLPEEGRRINRAFMWLMGIEYAPPPEPTPGALAGIGASAGQYTGPARIIRSEAEFDRIRPGDVLVCPVTTPTWSVLFSSASALVTDGGSILSHAAIIAREHNIPAVVATGTATRELTDGEQVTVDGTRGTVEPAG